MPDRVMLFIDYQNTYRRARDLYHPSGAPHWDGQVDPLRLGQLLVDRSPFDRELVQVRVYRGRPDSSRDAKGYAAYTSQCDRWRQGGVEVTTRTLRYPRNWPDCPPGERPQEKGIDVALAIDFVVLAIRDAYDVGILVSTDTDLKPALEAAADIGVRVEVAAWSSPVSHSRRLSVAGRKIWCHWLERADYDALRDPTDYTRAGLG